MRSFSHELVPRHSEDMLLTTVRIAHYVFRNTATFQLACSSGPVIAIRRDNAIITLLVLLTTSTNYNYYYSTITTLPLLLLQLLMLLLPLLLLIV